MIEHVMLTNNQGNVLLSKHMGEQDAEARKAWELRLFTAVKSRVKDMEEGDEEVAMSGGKFVVFTLIGAIFVFVTGSGDEDELSLVEVTRALSTMLRSLCRRNVVEAAVLEQFAPICMVVHEMVGQGFVDVLEKDRIKTFIRLKQGTYQ